MVTAKGAFTTLLLVLNVIFWFVPIITVALGRLLVPVEGWTDTANRWLMALGENWITCNKGILGLTQTITWDIRGAEHLRKREWYLVISNHQSGADILMLQAVLNRKIPFLKFFIKQKLIWVPLLGQAWWALDMPFMKRYTREFLAKHPEMRGQDLETTRQACEKFRRVPTSVINFVEGTRFSLEKQTARQSPYRYLLPPRAGGIAFVFGAMGNILHSLLDVTIVYDGSAPTLWDLCCGRASRVVVHIHERKIEHWLTQGDYAEDEAFRERLQQWLAAIWADKDELIASIREESENAASRQPAPGMT